MKNAEAAISCRKGGVKSLRTRGGGGGAGLKISRDEGLPTWEGDTFAGEGESAPYYMPCYSFITVLYLGATLEILHFPEAVQVFLNAIPIT